MAPTLLTVYPGDENAAVYAGTGGASFTNLSGTVTVTYADNPAVEFSPDGSISPGASVTLYETVWLYAPARAEVYVVPAAASGTSGGADTERYVFTDADLFNDSGEGWFTDPGTPLTVVRSGSIVVLSGIALYLAPATRAGYADDILQVVRPGTMPSSCLPEFGAMWDAYWSGGGSGAVATLRLSVDTAGEVDVPTLCDIQTPAGAVGWLVQIGDQTEAGETAVYAFFTVSWIAAP